MSEKVITKAAIVEALEKAVLPVMSTVGIYGIVSGYKNYPRCEGAEYRKVLKLLWELQEERIVNCTFTTMNERIWWLNERAK